MKLSQKLRDDNLELKIEGRIDAQWSDHLSSEIENAIHNGHHDIHLDMSEVAFMSSAGVRVLLNSYKQLKAISGTLLIINPSDAVKTILEMSGLMAMFKAKSSSSRTKPDHTTKTMKGETEFEVFASNLENKMTYRSVGDPELLQGISDGCGESTRVAIQTSTLSLGLGAFGEDHESCKDLFGEVLAAAGSAIHLPPTSAGTPDYMLSAGAFTPEVQMLYAAVCEGSFSDFLRFETHRDNKGTTLSHLAESLLEISGYQKVAIAMMAESAGLIGASLRQSPTKRSSGDVIFKYPDIRKWLSFSPERVFDRSLSFVVGILSSDDNESQNDPFLRPLGGDANALGHFHAAAFSYSPITRGRLSLEDTLAKTFEKETLQGVMHLLADKRDDNATMESEFKRGAIWMGELK
ncbi:MAG: STAS domain-containing protein [Phycisphaeraceae bacterium]|nr:STAS domain-containing protein [Phycisphaeraceae bacterium]